MQLLTNDQEIRRKSRALRSRGLVLADDHLHSLALRKGMDYLGYREMCTTIEIDFQL